MDNPLTLHELHSRAINMLAEVVNGLNDRLAVEHYDNLPRSGKFVRVEMLFLVNSDGSIARADRHADMSADLSEVLNADTFREIIARISSERLAGQLAALQRELQFQGGDDGQEN